MAATPTGDWHLDELGDGTYPYHLDDTTVSNHQGVAHLTPSTGNSNGKVCSAMDFSDNSINDTVVLRSDSINGAKDFTISVWLKGGNSNQHALLSGAGSGSHNALLLWFSNPKRFVSYINNSTTAYNIPDITDGDWHHFVFRRDDDEGCVFVDRQYSFWTGYTGTKVCDTVRTDTIRVQSWILGQEQDSTGGAFDGGQDWEGIVDEVLIFKEALSDYDITKIYKNEDDGKNWDGSSRTCQSGAPPVPSVDDDYLDYHLDELGWNGTSGDLKEAYHNKHGTGYDAPSVEGKICQAIDLRASGTSDYAKLHEDALDGAEDFTVSMWHKGSSSDSHALLSGAYSGSDNEFLEWFNGSGPNMDGHIHGDKHRWNRNSTNIHDDNWHHIVWSMYQQKGCLYIDTSLKECVYYDVPRTLQIESLILGQDQDNVGGGFNSGQDWEGIVDEIVIFRKRLTTSEISDIYNNQNAGKNWDGTTRTCPYPSVAKTSCVINDPVNAGTNPKRIPGATIRYAVEVRNPNTTTIENSIVDDNLSAGFDYTTVTTPKVISGSCDDCTGLSGGSSGGSSVSGNNVKIDFGDVAGGTLSSPTKECGYFEVEIK
jgi:MSHA biogenesis protein MshQ